MTRLDVEGVLAERAHDNHELLSQIRRLNDAGMTGSEIASAVGLSAGLISRYLRISNYPFLMEKVRDGELSLNKAVDAAQSQVSKGAIRVGSRSTDTPVVTVAVPDNGTVAVPDNGTVAVSIDEDFGGIAFDWRGKHYAITVTEVEE